MIEIINLNVSLGGTHILKDINLSIKEENSIIGIFGPNGAGKTTLISVLTGSINNYTGAVKGICAKDISYLPDKPFIYRYMKLEDAIKYYKDAFNDFDSDKAAKLLGKLGLKLNQKISQCSKGMLEQIHMVLALSRNSDVYIFDDIMEMIKSERKKESIVFISTHLISDVESLFDSVIMVKDGKVILYDNVQSLKKENKADLETIFKEKLR